MSTWRANVFFDVGIWVREMKWRSFSARQIRIISTRRVPSFCMQAFMCWRSNDANHVRVKCSIVLYSGICSLETERCESRHCYMPDFCACRHSCARDERHQSCMHDVLNRFVCRHLCTRDEAMRIMSGMDHSGDGSVDFIEFVRPRCIFSLSFQILPEAPCSRTPWFSWLQHDLCDPIQYFFVLSWEFSLSTLFISFYCRLWAMFHTHLYTS